MYAEVFIVAPPPSYFFFKDFPTNILYALILYLNLHSLKGKVVPIHAMEAYREN
jgi:hypothetical protein